MRRAPKQFDVVVVGAGTAGLAAYRAARAAGATALLIEGDEVGTTCARFGCMPSKALIAASELARDMGSAAKMGIALTGVAVDGREVMSRVRKLRDRFVESVEEGMARDVRRTEFVHGEARVRGPDLVDVDGYTVQAKSIVLAVGAPPVVPKPLSGSLLVSTYRELFDWETIPKRLAVVGAGPVGLELAQAFAGLGSEVDLIDQEDRLGISADAEVEACLLDALDDGLHLHLGATLTAANDEAGAVHLSWQSADGERHIRQFDRVLAATGRTPDLAELGVAAADVELDSEGRPLKFDPHTLHIHGTRIFLAGDVTGSRRQLHEAEWEGDLAGRNAARFPRVERVLRPPRLAVTFTHPQHAVIGRGRDTLHPGLHVRAVSPIGDSGRALLMDAPRGAIAIYAARGRGTLVGAELAMPAAEHVAHWLCSLIEQGVTARRAALLPAYHPTLEETVRRTLEELAQRVESRNLEAQVA